MENMFFNPVTQNEGFEIGDVVVLADKTQIMITDNSNDGWYSGVSKWEEEFYISSADVVSKATDGWALRVKKEFQNSLKKFGFVV